MSDNKEVDLLDIIEFFLQFLKSRIKFIFYLTLISLFISTAIYYTRKDVVTSTITLSARTLDYTEVETLAAPLLNLGQQKIDESAASTILYNPQQVNLICKILLSEVEPHPAERKRGCQFSFIVNAKDPSVFDELAPLFLSYLNSRPYVEKRTVQRKKYLNKMISEYDRLIVLLDGELKKISNGEGQLDSSSGYSGLYSELASLHQKKERAISQLIFTEEFSLFADFSIFKHKSKLSQHLLIGLTISIAIVFLVIIYCGISKMLKHKSEKNHFS